MYVHIICMYMYVRIICYVQFSNLTLNFCALGLCRRLGDFATKLSSHGASWGERLVGGFSRLLETPGKGIRYLSGWGKKKNWFSSTTKQKIRHFSCGQGSKLWSTFGCWWFLPYWGSDHFVPCPCAGCETNNRSGEITRHHGICEQLVTDSSIISSASKNHDISPLDYINAWKENTKQLPSISASETLGQLVA